MSGSSRSQLDIYDVCSAHKTGKRLLHAHCATFLFVLINLDQTGSYWIKMNHVGSCWITLNQNESIRSKCIKIYFIKSHFLEKSAPMMIYLRDQNILIFWLLLLSVIFLILISFCKLIELTLFIYYFR